MILELFLTPVSVNRITNLYKNAYSGLSPATWWLSVVMLINRSGTMVVPFMTLYLTETMSYSIGRAGIVMAVFGLGAVVGGMLGGKLTDKFGFYNIQLCALICGGMMFLVLGQMKSFPAICICAFVLSMLNDAFRPANATAIAQYSNEENRTRCYSLNRLAINLGWAVGGALGGIIASHNYHLIFWVDGVTNIGAAILLRAVLSPRKNSQTPAQPKTDATVKVRSAYSDKMYLVFIFLTILFGCCFFQLNSTLPVFYKQRLHLTPFFIGIVMAINGLIISLFEMALVFSIEGKNKNIKYITIGTLLCGLSYIVFNLVPGEKSVAVLAVCIVSIGEMLTFPFMNSFWISRTEHGNRGQYAGLYTVAWSVAQVAGPGIGSQVAQHFDFNTLWWGIGFVSVITALGFRYIQSRTAVK
jgi:predicted MFS family arabinose efflux permease